MRASRIRGGFLRALDRLLHTGAHPATPDAHAVDQLSPLLQVLRRLRRLGPKSPSAVAIRQRFHADMADFRVGFEIGDSQDLSIPTDHGTLAARLYRPRSPTRQAPLTVFFHGGGFVMGDLDTHDDACRLLCEGSGMPVLAVAYRLAPEAPFPAAVDDALASAHWALKQRDALGVTGLALGGDSAGANLAAVTAARLAQEGQPVVAQLLLYPGTDLSRSWPSHAQYGDGYFLDRTERDTFYGAYLGDVRAHATDWRVSPMLSNVPRGMAPALIVTGGHDMLTDEGQAYAQHLMRAHIPVQRLHFPRLGHAFINLASVHRESRAAVAQIAREWRALALTSPRN
ncbi:alpha/beta hydrolase [Aquabacterium sp. CECT 9606]|uniref:alpha/beta hydrolase n=1 Tax=Aquabacterium sp. CECT 9606 TaxID=2845822 RepID=UPI001E46EC2C|nr:alpha/beta hydrolase [Aquabacterium sp. CECT 9606]CAH0348188.1 Acetyl esterase [Aquabacterium sp. CECT 9606]